MDDDLRNGLWQACSEFCFNTWGRDYDFDAEFQSIMGEVYVDFFKRTSDVIPYGYTAGIEAVRKWFFNAKWWQVYIFLEFLISVSVDTSFTERGVVFLRARKIRLQNLAGSIRCHNG